MELKGYQRKMLRERAHGLKPVVLIGRRGVTETVIDEIDEALEHHELIKVKFTDFKGKKQKAELTALIEDETGAVSAGMIGHTVILYRTSQKPDRQHDFLKE
jgi:RNA-binding protein